MLATQTPQVIQKFSGHFTLIRSRLHETLLWILVLIILLIGYGVITTQWWSFIPSSVLIIKVVKYFHPTCWKARLGLTGPINLWVFCIVLCPLFYYFTRISLCYFFPQISNFHRIETNLTSYIGILFQCLNEELVFRGLFLTTSLGMNGRRMKIFLASLFFSGCHYFFYQYNIKLANQGNLNFITLLTLFVFSLSCGFFFIRYNSIALSLFFHAAWNCNRFSTTLISEETGTPILEYMTFNLIEGSPAIFTSSLILLIISTLGLAKKNAF